MIRFSIILNIVTVDADSGDSGVLMMMLILAILLHGRLLLWSLWVDEVFLAVMKAFFESLIQTSPKVSEDIDGGNRRRERTQVLQVASCCIHAVQATIPLAWFEIDELTPKPIDSADLEEVIVEVSEPTLGKEIVVIAQSNLW